MVRPLIGGRAGTLAAIAAACAVWAVLMGLTNREMLSMIRKKRGT
jgi:hypothetical protein